MRRELIFILLSTILGAFIGLAITLILAAIAVPAYSNFILTLTEKQGFDTMAKFAPFIADNMESVILIPLVLLAAVTSVFYFLVINPHLKHVRFKSRPGMLKLVVLILAAASLAALIYSSFKTVSIPGTIILTNTLTGKSEYSLISLFAGHFLTGGLFWLVFGEMGWGGDFSSWKPGCDTRKPKLFSCLILGGLVGLAGAGLQLSSDAFFSKYFILVSEVLDGSGEPSLLGFKLLGYGMMFIMGISGCIIAGLTVALSPTYRNSVYRIKWLIMPIFFSVITGAMLFQGYSIASEKYDLDKKNLAEAVGIDENASENRTVLIFKQDKKGKGTILQKWPMEVSYYGLAGNGTIEVSSENLRKIKKYINDHNEGSIFNYSAENAIISGYHLLLDAEKGLERQFASSDQILLHRLIMIRKKMQCVPLTSKNLNYLKAFTNESIWFVGAKASLDIANGFIHFGELKEAEKWINKAKEFGAKSEDIAKIEVPSRPGLVSGKISGRITVNGKPPANTRIAVVYYANEWAFDLGEDQKFRASNFLTTLTTRLVDAAELDNSGRFIFNNLGEGEYFIALMTDSGIVPYDISPEKVKVRNQPGIIRLDKSNAKVNLGNIDIAVKKAVLTAP